MGRTQPQNPPSAQAVQHPECCLGRDEICARLEKIPLTERAVLMVGGILTGKRTILQRLKKTFLNRAAEDYHLIVPVYADFRDLVLQGMGGNSIFQTLLMGCREALGQPPPKSLVHQAYPGPSMTVHNFAEELDKLVEARIKKGGNVHFAFLLNHCEKLADLPQEFHGNLTWLLFGGDNNHTSKDRISLILAGKPKVLELKAGPFSLIAERGAPDEVVENLCEADVRVMGTNLGVAESSMGAVYKATGGHAGLTRLLLEKLASTKPNTTTASVIKEFERTKEGFFNQVRSSFSDDAIHVQSLLLKNGRVHAHELPDSMNRDIFLELRASGIAKGTNREIEATGEMYWRYLGGAQAPSSNRDFPEPNERNNEFVFRQEGGGWVLRFGEETGSNWKKNKGLRRIWLLMSKSGDEMNVGELVQDGELSSDQLEINKAVDKELRGEGEGTECPTNPERLTGRDLRQKLNAVNSQLEEINGKLLLIHSPDGPDDEEVADLERKATELQNARAMLEDPLSPSNVRNSKKAMDAVRNSIFRDAIPEIEKRMPRLARHLRDAIIPNGCKYSYRPKTQVSWMLTPIKRD